MVAGGHEKLKNFADVALLLINHNRGSSCGRTFVDPTSSVPSVTLLSRGCVTGFNALGPALGFVMEHHAFGWKNFSGIDPKYDSVSHFLRNKPIIKDRRVNWLVGSFLVFS